MSTRAAAMVCGLLTLTAPVAGSVVRRVGRRRVGRVGLVGRGSAALAQDATKASATKKAPAVQNPAPSAKDWADIAKLPDWTGVWNPKITDQDAQVKTNMPPWKPEILAKINKMIEEERSRSSRRRSSSAACRRACRRGC